MSGEMFSSGRSTFPHDDSEAEEVFLNLTPMIDVLTTLLFFLLISFGAVIIGLISASVPVQSEEGNPNASTDIITLTLQITPQGFILTGQHDTMSEEELAKINRVFPKVKKEYDYAGLHKYLYQLKQHYPRSNTIVIIPSPGVSYEVLIGAMDASRERPSTFRGRPIRVPMFPEAVVSTIVE